MSTPFRDPGRRPEPWDARRADSEPRRCAAPESARLAAQIKEGRSLARQKEIRSCWRSLQSGRSSPTPGEKWGIAFRRRKILHSFRVAFESEWTIVQVREDDARYPGVIIDDLGLGESRLGIKHLVQVGQRKSTSIDGNRWAFGVIRRAAASSSPAASL
jgi:hypothetical protein